MKVKLKFKDFGRCLICLKNPCGCKKENSLDDLDSLKKKHDNHDWGSEENDDKLTETP